MSTFNKKKSFAIGYSFILHSAIMFWFQAGLTTSGNNVFIQYFMNTFGWSRFTLLNFVTVGAIIGVFGAIFFAQMVKNYGPRKITVISLILGGISVLLFSYTSSLIMFAITIICIATLAQGWAGVTTNSLITNWYPKKKAIILGITTMGLPMGSVAFVPLSFWLISATSFQTAYTALGLLMITIGVVSIFWVKDNPEDVGLAPDNEPLTDAQYQVAKNRLVTFKSQWTIKKLLRDRNAWLIGIAFGLLFMINRGVVAQLAFYYMDKGFTPSDAILWLSRVSLIGLLGSPIWGYIDDKLNTMRATIIYGTVYTIGFIFMGLDGSGATMWIGVILFEFCMGGISNLTPSIMITCYGRYEFPGVNRMLLPIVSLFTAFYASFVGVAIWLTGSTPRAMFICAAVAFISLILIFFIKPAPRTDIDYSTPDAEEKEKTADA